MTIIPEERRGRFLGMSERRWKKDGYEITSARENREMPATSASTPEGFRVAPEIGYKGRTSSSVTSPPLRHRVPGHRAPTRARRPRFPGRQGSAVRTLRLPVGRHTAVLAAPGTAG